MSSRGSYVLASVSRTVRTIELVAESEAIRLAELASCLGVSRPGAFRIAQTLVAHRWLVQGTDRRYRIGPAVRALVDPGPGSAEAPAQRPGCSTDA
ncbi:helix-turn-helix domain-containing protein [Cellulosimicrobium cellulans]|uniref:helix-turn-helix domain-containing protein n=1 Tax=Cellulosimicrobium cellulans TaxID=1710 RepID=UPI00196614E4|nr:helix-turn-helix domain-containing protein [Cellulosimicrobium cellulans]MBN0040011.1 helix-turn-helix domain-containing protein [Cellulosimicrobium cellulans]